MVDDRVREVLMLQLAGKWRAGKSHVALAEKYGVAIKTVQDWATQASRFQRMCLGDDDEVRMQLVANVARAGRMALKHKRTFYSEDGQERSYESPDFNAYLKAQELTGKWLLRDKPGADEGSDSIPEDQLAAALRALGWKVTKNEPTTARPEPASASPASDHDTERPERVEGFLEGGEED